MTFARLSKLRNVAVVACVAVATLVQPAHPVEAQEMTMQAPGDRVPFLASGGVLVLFRTDDAGQVYVAGIQALAPSSDVSSVELMEGDALVAVGDRAVSDLEGARTVLGAVENGAQVEVDVVRNGSTRRVQLMKASPDGVEGAVMVPEGAAGEAGGGMWMSAGGEDGRLELEIAGNQIRADEATGAPRVMFKRRHPRMAEVGLSALDIIATVNGTAVEDMQGFLAAYQAIPRGGQVEFTVIRDGSDHVLRFEKPTPEGR